MSYLKSSTNRLEVLMGLTLVLIVGACGLVFSNWSLAKGPLAPDAGRHFFHRGDLVPVREIEPGEELYVYREFCLNAPDWKPATLSVWFENSVVVKLPDRTARSCDRDFPCCRAASFPIHIPATLQPGRAMYRSKRITPLNPWKTVSQHMPDIVVEILPTNEIGRGHNHANRSE